MSPKELITNLFLILLGAYDLWKQQLPVAILMLFTIEAVISFFLMTGWQQIVSCLLVMSLIGFGILFARKGKIGGGDVWVLCILSCLLPADVFWNSMLCGMFLLSITALLVWGVSKNEKAQLPFLPFLLLGYWGRALL